MRRSILLFTTLLLLLQSRSIAQQSGTDTNLQQYFTEAYRQYPDLPKGMLEALAYSASHLQNLNADSDELVNCTGMPLRFGLFGLTQDGQGYFKNNLVEVAKLSNITVDQFKKDQRLQVLAVAHYLNEHAKARLSVEEFSPVLEAISEIPADGSTVNNFARKAFTYDVYLNIERGINSNKFKLAPATIQWKKIYNESTLRVLQSPGVQMNIQKDKVVTPTANYEAEKNGTVTANGTAGVQSADYGPAIWNAAATCNYGAGRGGAAVTNVGIHTTQGSYAGTISWFKNCAAGVSAHYVIRSSDGQVTQMVREADMAWHIGNNNSYTIGIEHEGFVTDASWYTEAMYQSSAALVRDICDSWGIDRNSVFRGPATATYNPIANTTRVKGHQHYTHPSKHTDPGANWNWVKYADLIKGFVIIPNGVYRIVHASSGRVLDALGCSGNNGTTLNIWDWWGGDCQRWYFEAAGDGYYKITCRLGGRALDNDRCLATDGNKIQLWDWLDNDCQRWRIQDWGNGTFRLVNKASGKNLDVSGDGSANGTTVFQWTSTGANAQRWTFQQVSSNYIANGVYRIRLAKNDKVLQPASGADNRGIAMSQSDWVDGASQKWNIEQTPDGWYKFSSPNGFALDLENCNTTEGGKVMLWDWLNNDCQRWGVSAQANGQWAIVSKASGKVLDAAGSANGDVVYQWTWLNNANQWWYIETPPAPVGKTANPLLNIAPNPVAAGTAIQLYYKADAAQTATITLTDIYGRPVQQRSVIVNKGMNSYQVSTGGLKAGVYNATIHLNDNSARISKKIIVR